MAKEFRIDHERISDSNKITGVMEKEFKTRGLDTKVNITTNIKDDPTTKQRIVTVKNTRYFGSWSHRG